MSEKTKTILVIEDEKSIRDLQQEELEEAGYNVILAIDGIDGIYKLKNEDIDAVILDIKMPNIDGRMTFRKIKEIKKDIPVIVNTAYNKYRSDFEQLQADAYIVKSFDLSELKKTLKEVLGQFF